MNKVINLTIGLWLIYLSVKALITGETIGGTSGFVHEVLFETSPIEFSINVIALTVFGIGFIWSTFKE